MSFGFSNVELRLSQFLINIQGCWIGVMESKGKRAYLVNDNIRDYRPLTQANSRRSFTSSHFSVESILVLLCLTASLLLLPLVLPPLPPPPSMLLLLPIGMLLVLIILAFMPSDVRDISKCHVQYSMDGLSIFFLCDWIFFFLNLWKEQIILGTFFLCWCVHGRR